MLWINTASQPFHCDLSLKKWNFPKGRCMIFQWRCKNSQGRCAPHLKIRPWLKRMFSATSDFAKGKLDLDKELGRCWNWHFIWGLGYSGLLFVTLWQPQIKMFNLMGFWFHFTGGKDGVYTVYVKKLFILPKVKIVKIESLGKINHFWTDSVLHTRTPYSVFSTCFA